VSLVLVVWGNGEQASELPVKAFAEQFSIPDFPGVSGVGFQMNTKGTHGEAEAFLQKVEYLSE
jgi:hypothetical protein